MRLVAITPGAHGVLSAAAAAPLAAALVIAPAAMPSPIAALIPAASAACSDAEVVFARGREEPPGVGAVGDALVNSLRGKTRMSVSVYGVNYPANISTGSGANDMSAHVQSMARSCPNTRIVLGGYSLGAEVADLVTGGRAGFGFINPLPPGADQHIAAVALFGNGNRGVAPAFAGKTIDQCAPGDPICGRGMNWPSHLQPSYIDSGLVDQAASFAAGKL
jgi:cutinase